MAKALGVDYRFDERLGCHFWECGNRQVKMTSGGCIRYSERMVEGRGWPRAMPPTPPLSARSMDEAVQYVHRFLFPGVMDIGQEEWRSGRHRKTIERRQEWRDYIASEGMKLMPLRKFWNVVWRLAVSAGCAWPLAAQVY